MLFPAKPSSYGLEAILSLRVLVCCFGRQCSRHLDAHTIFNSTVLNTSSISLHVFELHLLFSVVFLAGTFNIGSFIATTSV
jgi:hypothetical protein